MTRHRRGTVRAIKLYMQPSGVLQAVHSTVTGNEDLIYPAAARLRHATQMAFEHRQADRQAGRRGGCSTSP